MKKITLLLLLSLSLACSKDNDCDTIKAEINQRYDAQVEWVQNNTNPVDTNQITHINNERNIKLSQACN